MKKQNISKPNQGGDPVELIYPYGVEQVKKVEAYFSEPKVDASPRGTGLLNKKKKIRVNYFICFTNRCGSEFLADLISQGKRIGKAHEYFNFQYMEGFCKRHGITNYMDFLRGLQQRHGSQNGVFGSKVGVNQLFYLAKIGAFGNIFENSKFIHIKRRDLLSQAISFYIASKTQAWTSKHTIKTGNVPFDLIAIVKMMRNLAASNATFEYFFSLYGIQPLVVYYEDLEGNVERELKKIYRYLSVQFEGVPADENLLVKKQRNALNEEFRQKVYEAFYRRGLSPEAVLEPKSTIV